ncbi:hypothetical protein C8Q77DRAFT_212371 [Trametes polyzona]|nr:hypothetical protein C8Q77DRAFT_212371 [Trametes polyzona]
MRRSACRAPSPVAHARTNVSHPDPATPTLRRIGPQTVPYATHPIPSRPVRPHPSDSPCTSFVFRSPPSSSPSSSISLSLAPLPPGELLRLVSAAAASVSSYVSHSPSPPVSSPPLPPTHVFSRPHTLTPVSSTSPCSRPCADGGGRCIRVVHTKKKRSSVGSPQ